MKIRKSLLKISIIILAILFSVLFILNLGNQSQPDPDLSPLPPGAPQIPIIGDPENIKDTVEGARDDPENFTKTTWTWLADQITNWPPTKLLNDLAIKFLSPVTKIIMNQPYEFSFTFFFVFYFWLFFAIAIGKILDLKTTWKMGWIFGIVGTIALSYTTLYHLIAQGLIALISLSETWYLQIAIGAGIFIGLFFLSALEANIFESMRKKQEQAVIDKASQEQKQSQDKNTDAAKGEAVLEAVGRKLKTQK
ncbi:MAG: hypothetical protein KKF56_02580 [Nanoarchaeota archaeon]|nr:hypothetical protein [Nanoarchaeota archaeon]